MSLDRARYLRQILLTGVGEEGQRKITAARATIPQGIDEQTRFVARRYLESAGLGAIDESGPADPPPWLADAVTDPAARAVVAGSLIALDQLRRAIK